MKSIPNEDTACPAYVCLATGGRSDLIHLGKNRFDRHYTQNSSSLSAQRLCRSGRAHPGFSLQVDRTGRSSLTLFSHPETVRQTGGKALFPTIRNAARRRQKAEVDGRLLAYDDNKSPTDAFLWCNEITKKLKDVQFNHVYLNSQDPDQYTSLANICVTPAFLAKLTDTNEPVRKLLRYRAYDLYRWVPAGHEPPPEPAGYVDLQWAPTLPPVSDVAAAITPPWSGGLSTGRFKLPERLDRCSAEWPPEEPKAFLPERAHEAFTTSGQPAYRKE